MTSSTKLSWLWWGLALLAAQVTQVAAFGPVSWQLSWQGVAPNLVLLVVVAGALRHGARSALALGFAGGLLLDLAPPADDVAGRWALALLAVGYVAGRLRPAPDPLAATFSGVGFEESPRVPWLQILAAVAAGSFVGTSVYALTGMVLGATAHAVPQLLGVVAAGLAADVVAAVVGVAAYRLGARLLRRRRHLGWGGGTVRRDQETERVPA